VRNLSLSTYFPNGTTYFYGYPVGESSGFLNRLEAAGEELIAARAFGCTGSNVTAVGFASARPSAEERQLYAALRVAQPDHERIVRLPEEIDARLTGAERNRAIKAALQTLVPPGTLAMAQPHTDGDLHHLYQISPALTAWLNDKNHMPEFFDSEWLPRRLAQYQDGADFAAHHAGLPLPCVVKVSSSSAGDGVYICQRRSDLDRAVAALKDVTGTIMVEEFIDAARDYAVHFGVPHDATAPVEILGVNEQIVSSSGRFQAGIIQSAAFPWELGGAVRYLRDIVLPRVRDMGWYGVGGLDVLVDRAGRVLFIDGNFRMTAMTPYHFLVANGALTAPAITFTGEITGDATTAAKVLLPHAQGPHARMHLINLVQSRGTWRFNGALSCSSKTELIAVARELLRAGVRSQVLESVSAELLVSTH
jgi:hypothetical protein